MLEIGLEFGVLYSWLLPIVSVATGSFLGIATTIDMIQKSSVTQA